MLEEVAFAFAFAVEVIFENGEAVDDGLVVLSVKCQHRSRSRQPTWERIPAVPPLSHGLGGEAVLILSAMAVTKVTSVAKEI